MFTSSTGILKLQKCLELVVFVTIKTNLLLITHKHNICTNIVSYVYFLTLLQLSYRNLLHPLYGNVKYPYNPACS